MNRQVKVQIAVLAGVFGFFLGGLINAGREIIGMTLGAVVGWAVFFFAAFIVLDFIYKSPEEKGETGPAVTRTKKTGAEKSKGKKIDITVKGDESFDDIYKLK